MPVKPIWNTMTIHLHKKQIPAFFVFNPQDFVFRPPGVLLISPLSTLEIVWCSAERPELAYDSDGTGFAESNIFGHRRSDLIGHFRKRETYLPIVVN